MKKLSEIIMMNTKFLRGTEDKLLLGYIFLMVLVSLHVPFLNADPDIGIYPSRGPFTDEGIYSLQVRNYLIDGNLYLDNSDGIAKTPLFSALLFIGFNLFGADLLVARLLVLSVYILFLGIAITNKYFNRIFILLCLTTLIQYYIFHFSHFGMSDMLSTVSVFLSCYIIYKFFVTERSLYKHMYIFGAALALGAAYTFKILYVYMIPLLPLSLTVFWIFAVLKNKKTDVSFLKYIVSSLFFTGVVLLIYYLAVFKSFEDQITYVMNTQVDERTNMTNIYRLAANIKSRLHLIFRVYKGSIVPLSSLVVLIPGIIYLFRRKINDYTYIFIVAISWLLLESHKLIIGAYIPPRYLLSFYLACGMVLSTGLACVMEDLRNKLRYKRILTVTIAILIIVVSVNNLYDLSKSYARRSYQINEISTYLGKSLKGSNGIVMGPWAPSLTWKTQAISLPIWKDYYNYKNVIDNFQPELIILEEDEEDSRKAFQAEGINLYDYADTVETVEVAGWKIMLFWMKKRK